MCTKTPGVQKQLTRKVGGREKHGRCVAGRCDDPNTGRASGVTKSQRFRVPDLPHWPCLGRSPRYDVTRLRRHKRCFPGAATEITNVRPLCNGNIQYSGDILLGCTINVGTYPFFYVISHLCPYPRLKKGKLFSWPLPSPHHHKIRKIRTDICRQILVGT